MRPLLAVATIAACGTEWSPPQPVARAVPQRMRLLTDAQYGNAVHDLLGDDVVVPPFQTPGTTPDALIQDDDVLSVEPMVLVQYRVVAQTIGHALSPDKLGCAASDAPCARAAVHDFATRAFRRPLDADEDAALQAMYADGGFPLVVEAVLQAPSFVYRSELGGAPDGSGVVTLAPHELASELSFLFYDSIPDDPLRARADDGTLADPAVLAAQVDRLLASPRVRAHLDDVMLRWLEVRGVYSATKDATMFPEFDYQLADSMVEETRYFVDDVLWKRRGSLGELLVSPTSFANARVAELYGMSGVPADSFVPIHHDERRRAGVLTHASVLAMLASPERESIVQRGMFVHRHFLCTPEMGRPPFAAIAGVADFTGKLSESQFSYYREANVYCGTCHRTVDPPGRLLEQFDGLGRFRAVDELGVPVEAWARITIDGVPYDLDGAVALAHALADSDRVAGCVVDQMTHHAFGREIDAVYRADLWSGFDDSGRDLVALFRAIATSPAFRVRQGATP
jgi:hypothetical protein